MTKNYVQIGSNIGNDHFYDICKNLNEKANIYLIEPNQELIPVLKLNYFPILEKHNLYFENVGIVTPQTKDVNKLYLYRDGRGEENSGLSSILKRKSHPLIYDVITFTPILFNDFCISKNIKDIELLSIDTEGLDYDILNNIDLDFYNIKTIFFELWPYDNDDEENKVQTGKALLNLLEKKYFNYKLSQCSFDNQASYRLDKK